MATMPGDRLGEAGRPTSTGSTQVRWNQIAPGLYRNSAINYRAPPEELSVPELVAQIAWLDDAPSWRGKLGRYARQRRDALRNELRRREMAA